MGESLSSSLSVSESLLDAEVALKLEPLVADDVEDWVVAVDEVADE